MADLKYHIAQTEGKRDAYGPNETADFKASYASRKLVGNNIRILGEVIATNNTSLTQFVAYDGFVGSHNFFDSINTSSSLIGQLENIENYGRFVSSKAKAYLSKEDLFNSIYVCENRVPDEVLAVKLLKGVCDGGVQNGSGGNIVAARTKKLDFAMQADFCLNNCIGDNLLPYDVFGDLTISVNTATILKALFGDIVTPNVSYELSNLRLYYTTVADDGKRSKYTMRVKSSIKQTISSSFANISTTVPMVCDSFWMTFIQQAQEASEAVNSMQNQRLPNVKRLEILWNDSASQQFTYAIDNEEEILSNYIKAVSSVVGNNSASLQQLAANDSYGMGISFGSVIDLSKVKLGVNIQSDVQSTNPYTAYMYFSGLLTV